MTLKVIWSVHICGRRQRQGWQRLWCFSTGKQSQSKNYSKSIFFSFFGLLKTTGRVFDFWPETELVGATKIK